MSDKSNNQTQNNNIEFGKRGEKLAVDYLIAKGYKILEKNWRFKRAEVDIIAKNNEGILVFVEVKTRSYTFYGEPEVFVDEKKKQLLLDAASQYMNEVEYEWAIRFDIIGIVIDKYENIKISHFEDAFFS
jgi:putative endonuclease